STSPRSPPPGSPLVASARHRQPSRRPRAPRLRGATAALAPARHRLADEKRMLGVCRMLDLDHAPAAARALLRQQVADSEPAGVAPDASERALGGAVRVVQLDVVVPALAGRGMPGGVQTPDLAAHPAAEPIVLEGSNQRTVLARLELDWR